MGTRKLRHVAALSLLATLVLTACGGDASGGGATDTETGTGAAVDGGGATEEMPTDDQTSSAGGDVVAEAQADVDELIVTEGVEFPEPPGPFDAGSGRVAIISCGQAGVGCQQMTEFAQSAAEAMGWESSPTFDGEFSPATQAGFVQQAVNEGYDAIILASIDAASIQAAVDAAAEAGIPVACVMCVNEGFEGKVIDATTGGTQGGDAMGAWLIADSQGTAKVLAFHDRAFPIVTLRMAAMEERLSQCEACSYEEIDIPTTDLSEPGPPTWTGALSANPPGSFNYAAAPYDFFSIPMARTAVEQGRDGIKITGFDAWSEMNQNIGSGDLPVAATIAAPFEYASWAAMDEVARVVAGEDTWDATNLPVRLVVKENADEFSQGFFAPAFDVPEFFSQLWGDS